MDNPTGRVPALLPPAFTDPSPRMDPVPAAGEHTDAILGELGRDDDAIRELRAQRIV